MTSWAVEHGMVVRRIEGPGPTLVWIHGLGEWSLGFDAIARHPQLSGFSHVLPDLPGYGRSPWPPGVNALPLELGTRGTVHALADHLAEWLHAQPRAFLVGHSLGGVLAQFVADRIPARGVFDIEGNISRGDCTFSAQAIAYSEEDFVTHGFTAMREAVFARGVTEPAMRGYHAAMLAADAATFYRNARDLVAISEEARRPAELAGVTCPHRYVAGLHGGICEESRRLLDVHGVNWIGIDGAGHWPHVDQRDVVAESIATFVHAHA